MKRWISRSDRDISRLVVCIADDCQQPTVTEPIVDETKYKVSTDDRLAFVDYKINVFLNEQSLCNVWSYRLKMSTEERSVRITYDGVVEDTSLSPSTVLIDLENKTQRR